MCSVIFSLGVFSIASNMEISVEAFDKICRACLRVSPNMQPLLSKLKGDDRYLLEILASVANLDIKFEDTLPKQVCSDCQATIYKADEFRQQCLQSEALLINLNERNTHECNLDKKTTIKCDPGNYIAESSANNSCNDKAESLDDSFDRKDLVFSEFNCFTPDNLETIKTDEEGSMKDESDVKTIKMQLNHEMEAEDLFSHEFEDQMTILPVEFKPRNTKSKMKCTCHCGMKFKCKETLKRHMKKLNCDKINKIINKCQNLVKNQVPMLFRCEMCSEKFDTITAWNTHQNKHQIKIPNIKIENRDTEFFCSECDRKFKNKKSLRSHIRRHENKSRITYTCEECKREFKYKAYLDNHILSLHTRDKGLTCQYCAKSFATEESLNIHKEGHKVEKKHQCSVCNKAFLMLCTLKDHMRTHTGEKPFLCSICGKGFSQKNNLAQHMRRHQGLKPFKCETCEKGFVSKGELDAHERKHSGAHPFVCDDCNHGFTTSSALVKHRRIHTGERPYSCDLCPMRFAASGTLKNHRRTHTGEKPFQCSYCDKAFVQKSDLISHIRCHTGERPYICTQCGHAFRKAAALKTHVRMHGKDGSSVVMPVNGLLAGLPIQ